MKLMMNNGCIKPPQFIIVICLAVLLGLAYFLKMDLAGLFNESLIKLVMNGVLVLSLIPMLNAGAGMNFGLPVGITGGLIGMCIAVNFRLAGWPGFFMSLLLSVAICGILGWIYGLILTGSRGGRKLRDIGLPDPADELFLDPWRLFQNRQMLYPIGGLGLRPKITWSLIFIISWTILGLVKLGPLEIPCLLGFYGLICLGLYLFFRTKAGRAAMATGENEAFARLSGIDIAGARLLAIILSTVIAGIGICVYSQSYGFIQLYDAPLAMYFPAISAVLIGGSNGRRAFIFQAALGAYLLQTIYLLTVPIANEILVPEITEILRTLITYSIILYALLYRERRGGAA